MKIQIKNAATSSDVSIPAGDYWVSLNNETGQIRLAGHGVNYDLPATRRPNKGKVMSTKVLYYSLGGPSWTLSVSTPRGEWAAFINIK
jgi:hypothetical protein